MLSCLRRAMHCKRSQEVKVQTRVPLLWQCLIDLRNKYFDDLLDNNNDKNNTINNITSKDHKYNLKPGWLGITSKCTYYNSPNIVLGILTLL